jgi:hypothetical protein
MELDLVQSGDMSVEIKGGAYPRSPDVISTNNFTENTARIAPQLNQRRYMRIRFTSNVQNGYFEIGQPMLRFKVKGGDMKP